MESLAKLIRRKSADNLRVERLYEHLWVDEVRSVYDPRDYEDVAVVGNRKIEKNIKRGRFRKGRRVTMEEKLRRFAESIKPAPVARDNGLLRGLLYWKPPKQLRVQRRQPESQQSMIKLLEDKELYCEDITSIQVIDLDDDAAPRLPRRKGTRPDEETVVNDTYDPSVEFVEEDDEHDLNAFWNKNYARKQHLPRPRVQTRFDENGLRVFHHEPLKKRRSRLNELRVNRY